MRKFLISIIYVSGIVVLGKVSSAQDGSWTHWTTTNAMSHLVVQDTFVWAGINEGLIRYNTIDGSYKRFTTENGLPNNRMRPLILDNDSNLWAGYYGIICRFDGKAWTTWTKNDGIPDAILRCTLIDHTGSLWFGFGEGFVSRFDGDHWATWRDKESGPYSSITELAEDSSGNIWAATCCSGLYRFDGTFWKSYGSVDEHDSMLSMVIDRNDNVWIGTGEKVTRFDGTSWRSWTLHPDLPNRHVWSLLEDSDGNIWAGSGGGVSRFDGMEWSHWTPEDGMPSRISLLHEDSQGKIWAASSYAPWGEYLESGIFVFDGSNWKKWTKDDDLASNIIYSLIEDDNGIMWAGTDGGLCYYDGYQWKSWEWQPCIYGAEVFDIIDDGNGSIWVSTYAGVSRFDGITWTKMLDYPGYNFAGPTPDGPFELDSSGNVWVGLGYYNENGLSCIGGMSRYDGENWTVWTWKTPDFYFTGFVRDLLLDSSGNMWVGTERAGAIMFDGERWSDWLEDEFLENRKIYALLEDDHGNIWAGSDDSRQYLGRFR